MIVLETIEVAFAMFSALPVPQPVWNEKNMRYAMCAFPLVGVVCGGCWWAWAEVCRILALPELLRGLSDYRMLIYAVVLIVMMLFNWSPKAIEWREKYSSRFRRKNGKSAKEAA